MNKKHEMMKTVQLILTIVIAVIALIVIFTNNDLYQLIGHSLSAQILCGLLWFSLVLSFIAVYFDFQEIAHSHRNYRELDYTVHNDHVAGIANRFSCDTIIEKYADKPLPSNIGCIMIELSNIRSINQQYGHSVGNSMIQAFSGILNSSSVGLCFVGRNGGNTFMALFEDCTDEKLSTFMTRLARKIEVHNLQKDIPRLEYRSGMAFHEDAAISSITQLIALADRRIVNQTETVSGR